MLLNRAYLFIDHWIASSLIEIRQCSCDGRYRITSTFKQCRIKLKEGDGNSKVGLSRSCREEALLDQMLCERGAFAHWYVNSLVV